LQIAVIKNFGREYFASTVRIDCHFDQTANIKGEGENFANPQFMEIFSLENPLVLARENLVNLQASIC